MSDTLSNALRGNSLLDRIANPTVVNPLASQARGLDVAQKLWANREAQARQAAGEAFQNSIGPGGTPDQTALLQNLKAAGPGAALAAQASAQLGQNLDNSTYDTHMKRLTGLNAAAMALTAQHPNGVPQAAVNAELDRIGPQFGLTPAQIAQAKTSFGSDPVANSRTIIRNSISNLTAQDALHASVPKTSYTDVGGHLIPLQEPPLASGQGGTVDVAGGPMITRTQTAGEQAAETPLYSKNADGTYTLAPSPRSDRPGAITTPTVTQLPRGGGGGAVPPVPSPIPGGGVYHPRGGAAPAPQTGGAAQPTSTPTPTAPAQPAPATSAPAPLLSAPPQGQPEALKVDIENYKKAQTTLPSLQTSDQNMNMALDALRQTYTGPGTDNTHALFAYLQSVGLLPPGATDEIKNNQLFRKATERRIAELGMAAGTDAGRALAQQSNAGTLLNNEANLEVLRNDIGKNRQAMLPILLHKNGGVGYGDDVAKLGSPGYVDFRGLNWDQYSGPEQAKILKSVEGNKAADLALHRAIGIGHTVNFGAESKAP